MKKIRLILPIVILSLFLNQTALSMERPVEFLPIALPTVFIPFINVFQNSENHDEIKANTLIHKNQRRITTFSILEFDLANPNQTSIFYGEIAKLQAQEIYNFLIFIFSKEEKLKSQYAQYKSAKMSELRAQLSADLKNLRELLANSGDFQELLDLVDFLQVGEHPDFLITQSYIPVTPINEDALLVNALFEVIIRGGEFDELQERLTEIVDHQIKSLYLNGIFNSYLKKIQVVCADIPDNKPAAKTNKTNQCCNIF